MNTKQFKLVSILSAVTGALALFAFRVLRRRRTFNFLQYLESSQVFHEADVYLGNIRSSYFGVSSALESFENCYSLCDPESPHKQHPDRAHILVGALLYCLRHDPHPLYSQRRDETNKLISHVCQHFQYKNLEDEAMMYLKHRLQQYKPSDFKFEKD